MRTLYSVLDVGVKLRFLVSENVYDNIETSALATFDWIHTWLSKTRFEFENQNLHFMNRELNQIVRYD